MSFSDMTGKMLNSIHLHKPRHETQLHPMFLLKCILVFSTHIHQVGPEIHLIQTRRLCPTTIYRLHHPLSLCEGLHNLPPWGLQKTKYQENLQVLGSEKAWIKKNAEQPSGGKGYHMFIHPWHQTNNYITICWAPQCHNQMNILVANTINLCKTTSQTDHHCLHLRWKANPYMSISLKVVSKANVFWESFNRVATRFRNRVIGIWQIYHMSQLIRKQSNCHGKHHQTND